jgi:hypothetical protein
VEQNSKKDTYWSEFTMAYSPLLSMSLSMHWQTTNATYSPIISGFLQVHFLLSAMLVIASHPAYAPYTHEHTHIHTFFTWLFLFLPQFRCTFLGKPFCNTDDMAYSHSLSPLSSVGIIIIQHLGKCLALSSSINTFENNEKMVNSVH